MKFNKIIGKIDQKLIAKAEEIMTHVFIELGARYDNEHIGTGIGGDPLIFSLLYPVEHICTLNIPTAATDGRRYFWNPKWIIKQHKLGLRLICAHEAWHALYMHAQRRGSRNPKLWNIAVDYIVNGVVMEDLKCRKLDPKEIFNKNLGRYMTLDQYSILLKNPKAKIKGFEDIHPGDDSNVSDVKLPSPNEDRELTPAEKKELERLEKKVSFFYADPDIAADMKRPEKIYDYLYNLLPKCPKCGRLGVYNLKDKSKKKQVSDKKKQKDHSCGDTDCNCEGEQSYQPKHGKGCDECSDGFDIFGFGSTLDDHMDTDGTEEKSAQRYQDAVDTARRMAGNIPSSIEDEIGKLTAPKISWKDIVRTKLLKSRSGNGRNDWTRFRTRPMFGGLLVPKRRNYFAHFGCLLDTSASMSKDDMAFGLSQLCSLDERSEGTIVPADAQIYWDDATKIKKADKEQICQVKVVGRGGTKFAEFFRDYEKNIGKCEFLIVITDGMLNDMDIVEMKNPGIDVIWLLTSSTSFNAPFGRVFDLLNS